MVAITLLCLSESAPGKSAEILSLMGTAGIGLESARVATKPAELFTGREPLDLHGILIIDCVEHDFYDIPRLISFLRSQRCSGIMVAVRSHRERRAAIEAGADIAFRLPLLPLSFLAEVHDLMEYYASIEEPPVQAHVHDTADLEPRHGTAFSRNPIGSDLGCGAMEPVVALNEGNRKAPKPQFRAEPTWQLVAGPRPFVKSPEGREVSLTRQEYSFIDALFKAEDRRVTHRAWQVLSGKPEDMEGQQKMLAVVVSRIRRKFFDAGIELPLKADRGRGYWFHGDCVVLGLSTPRSARVRRTSTPGFIPNGGAVQEHSESDRSDPPMVRPGRWDVQNYRLVKGAESDARC